MERSVTVHLRRNVVAYLALFVALGGTAWAGSQIRSKDIKNGSVKSKDIKDDGLKGKDLRDGTVKGKDLAAGTIGTEQIVDESLRSKDIENGTLSGSDVADDGLGGGQIDESSLVMPASPETAPVGRSQSNDEAQLFTDSTFTVVELPDAEFANGVSFSAGTDKLTIDEPGLYLVEGEMGWGATVAAGARSLQLRRNNASVSHDERPGGDGTVRSRISTVLPLDAGDTIHLVARQESGGTISSGTQGLAMPLAILTVVRLGPAP